jgi:DNA polymerase (family 10)
VNSAAAAIFARIGGGAAGRALARRLAREGVRTLADLRRAAVFARLPRAAQAAVRYPPRRAVPAAEAAAVAAAVVAAVVVPRAWEVVPVGSVRRRARTSKDLDFLVVVPRAADVAGALAALRWRPGAPVAVADTYATGARRRSCILRYRRPGRGYAHYRADFFVCPEAERAFALMHLTGPASYNIRLRARAKAAGHRLNQYGIFDAAGRRLRGSGAVRTEEQLAAFLGVTPRPPNRRF